MPHVRSYTVATPRKVGGYVFRQELARAINANREARRAIGRLLDGEVTPRLLALYVAKAARALAENLDALREIEEITRQVKGDDA